MLTKLAPETNSTYRSLQIYNDLKCVIRELIENSLDAHSTEIEIKIVNDGHTSILVRDNGCGIHESNFKALGELIIRSFLSPEEYHIEDSKFRRYHVYAQYIRVQG